MLDSLQIENSLQEPLNATRFLFSGNKDERRYHGTNKLKRTYRKMYRKRHMCNKSAKQPKRKSKNENQYKEFER